MGTMAVELTAAGSVMSIVRIQKLLCASTQESNDAHNVQVSI